MTPAASTPAAAEAPGDFRSVLRESLHVWALFVLVVVQPLLDLLAPNLPFFLHHRADPVDLAVLLFVLVVLLPGLLVALEAAVFRLAGARVRHFVHLAILALLVAVFGLEICRSFQIGSVLLAGPLAAALAAAFLRVYRRRGVRLFLGYLVWGVPLVVVVFLASRDILGYVVETVVPVYPEVEVASETPVVLVVFDEFPLLSLLDAQERIDADHFPEFARLAATSTWYRNATTVHSRTQEAMAAILTGTMPVIDKAPTLSNYPRNLFTLLHRSHELRVYEHHTQFVPSDYLPESTWRERWRRLRRMMPDLGVVFLHLISPAAQARELQSLSWRWGFFVPVITDEEEVDDPRRLEVDYPTFDPYQRRQAFSRFLSGIERSSRPTLDFFHSNLPHIPFCYLPSGRVYGGRPFMRGSFVEAWNEDTFFVLQVYQRHLLQVQYVDRLIGDLTARLKSEGLWDESAVVVTADHGASHWPSVSRRTPVGHEPQIDEIQRVPLFIKRPYQTAGELSDRNVQSIDVLPTLLDAIDVDVDWSFDGQPASAATEPARKVMADRFGKTRVRDGRFALDRRSLGRKLELFGAAAEPYSFYRIGPYGHLLGRSVAEVGIAGSLAFDVTIDQAPFLEDYDPSSSYVPAELTGVFEIDGGEGEEVHLAFALHGRIEAVTRTVLAGGAGLFSALVPEAALRPGANAVDVFVVRAGPTGEAQLFQRSGRASRRM